MLVVLHVSIKSNNRQHFQAAMWQKELNVVNHQKNYLRTSLIKQASSGCCSYNVTAKAKNKQTTKEEFLQYSWQKQYGPLCQTAGTVSSCVCPDSWSQLQNEGEKTFLFLPALAWKDDVDSDIAAEAVPSVIKVKNWVQKAICTFSLSRHIWASKYCCVCCSPNHFSHLPRISRPYSRVKTCFETVLKILIKRSHFLINSCVCLSKVGTNGLSCMSFQIVWIL